jgi:hypothetical protein
MNSKQPFIVLCFVLCLCSFVPLCLYAQETKTERFDFPPGGVLHLNHSDGELTIQGWDRPEVEITTIKAKHPYRSDGRYAAVLTKIQITAGWGGNELVVNTKFPQYRHFDLEYRISAPGNASVVVDHNAGEVYIDNLADDIRVKVHDGAINLRLPEDNNHSIDANTGKGSVISDVPGRWHRRLWPLVQRHEENDATPHRLHLPVGYGEIAILKIRRPPYALASNSRHGVNP